MKRLLSTRLLNLSSYIVATLFAHSLPRATADEFPELYNSEPIVAEPMSPETAAKAFKMPTGFEVQAFAAEPLVQNPIAMTWDPKGQLWIAENYTYAEREQRFDLSLRDRIIVLQDTNGDGIPEQRKVFTDNVQMLTSVEVGHGGVWAMCPPMLLFFPDANHDEVPDAEPRVVLDGFHVASENYHNFANGLRWGPDGWLYGRCGGSCPGNVGKPGTPDDQRVALEGGMWRYHPQKGFFEALCHGTTNPWGHDWNVDDECFFVNTVNGHLWHMIPGAHYVRPFTLDPNTKTYELIDLHADHWHFDTGRPWQESRDGAANDFGGGHAHIGCMIYQGDQWPVEYHGNLFTFNFHGARLNQEKLEREGSGYIARHSDDIFFAGDKFFRGMDLSEGPDGKVYVIDWSDTGECHEHTGVHRTSGRVYSISYDQSDSLPNTHQPSNLYDAADTELLTFALGANRWYAKQARSVLQERNAANLLSDATQKALLEYPCKDERQRRRLIQLQYDLGLKTAAEIAASYSSYTHEQATTLIKLLSDSWQLDDCYGPAFIDPKRQTVIRDEVSRTLPTMIEIAEQSASPAARLALASTIQRVPLSDRITLAKFLMSYEEDADDHNLPLLVWYGLIPVANEPGLRDELAQLAMDSKWPKTQQFVIRRLTELIDETPTAVNALLEHVVRKNDEGTAIAILTGIEIGLKGVRRATEPAAWQTVSTTFAKSTSKDLQSLTQRISLVFGDGQALEDIKALVLDREADIGLRQSALESMVATRAEDLREVCMAVVRDSRLNVVAAKGLAMFDDQEVAEKLIAAYWSFRAPERPNVIALLCSRERFAKVLLKSIEEGKMDASHLTAFDIRQINAIADGKFHGKTIELWGDVRETDEQKQRRIAYLRTLLSDEKHEQADLANGRRLFDKTCSKCHRMYGIGDQFGPDLTGSNRSNLDFLIPNIVDPSATVSKDFCMSIILTTDDRTISGLILSQDDRLVRVQTQTDKVEIPTDEVDSIKATTLSPMPDGLLDSLTEQEIADLIGYLSHPSQVEYSAK